MDDIVIEIKVRLSGLTYDQAREVRDMLRNAEDVSMLAIVDEVRAVAEEVAPFAKVAAFNPWAEWRPARGKKQRKVEA